MYTTRFTSSLHEWCASNTGQADPCRRKVSRTASKACSTCYICIWLNLQVVLPPLASTAPSPLRMPPTAAAQPQLQQQQMPPRQHELNSARMHSAAAPVTLPTAQAHDATDPTLWGGPAELTMGSTCSSTDDTSDDDDDSNASVYFISEADFLMHQVQSPVAPMLVTGTCSPLQVRPACVRTDLLMPSVQVRSYKYCMLSASLVCLSEFYFQVFHLGLTSFLHIMSLLLDMQFGYIAPLPPPLPPFAAMQDCR
jgi:hypothetical protein